MEYASKGNFADFFRDNRAFLQNSGIKALFLTQILAALKFMHEEKQTMHRDLKAENVLITVEDQGNLRIKLSDFGESRDMADTAEYITQVGTEYYMAPEVGSG